MLSQAIQVVHLLIGVATLLVALRALRRPPAAATGPTDIHDHEAHDHGVLAELRESAKAGGGRVHLHDVEVVMRRRRDRRRREG